MKLKKGHIVGLEKWIGEVSRRMSDGFSRLEQRVDRGDRRLEERMDHRLALFDEKIERIRSSR